MILLGWVYNVFDNVFVLGSVDFQHLGLPGDVFETWIKKIKFNPKIVEVVSNPKPLKNSEIPLLKDYNEEPNLDFWSKFPSRPLPHKSQPNTPLNADMFEQEFLLMKEQLSFPICQSVLQTIKNLRFGADSLVDYEKIRPLFDTNASNMGLQKIGSQFTDQLVTMIKKGYVSGPFLKSPFDNARINSLFVVEQTDKYRPILNLSAPEGNSFNEAIIDNKMTKVIMSSPALVAKKLYSIGKGAYLSKIDHQSAYKLVPTKFDDLYLQGFFWMNRFFFETSQIFGARSSVPNYDNLHYSFSSMVKVKTDTVNLYLERQLDDQIVMTKTLEENQIFVEEYLRLANVINLPLAPMDKPDKAFLYQQKGVILGVFFDTLNMTWTLPVDKRNKYIKHIATVLQSTFVSKQEIQQVLGMINTVVQMCPPLRFLKTPIILDLKMSYESEPIPFSCDTKDFLHQWMFILDELQHSFPITDKNNCYPARSIVFVSDAAGCASYYSEYEIGIGAVGYVMPHSELQDFFYVGQCLWPTDFICTLFDDDGKKFGNKTTLLESIGLLISLFHNYKLIHNKHVVCKVDNVAVVWAYVNGKSRQDPYTSLIVAVLNHIAVSTPFKLYVEHLPRVSTLPALVADTLSRTDPKGQYLVDHIGRPLQNNWPPSLLSWLKNPVIDWSLRSKILQDFRATLWVTVFGCFYFFWCFSSIW